MTVQIAAQRRGCAKTEAFVLVLGLLAAYPAMSGSAAADTPVERGAYLVNTVMACGNCHTPRNADGGRP